MVKSIGLDESQTMIPKLMVDCTFPAEITLDQEPRLSKRLPLESNQLHTMILSPENTTSIMLEITNPLSPTSKLSSSLDQDLMDLPCDLGFLCEPSSTYCYIHSASIKPLTLTPLSPEQPKVTPSCEQSYVSEPELMISNQTGEAPLVHHPFGESFQIIEDIIPFDWSFIRDNFHDSCGDHKLNDKFL